MSFTVVNDNGAINVRAIIASRDEMKQLVEALGKAEEKLPPPLQTTDHPLPQGFAAKPEWANEAKDIVFADKEKQQ